MQQQNDFEVRAGKECIYTDNDAKEAHEAFKAAALKPEYYDRTIDLLYKGRLVAGFKERIGYRPTEDNRKQTDS
uniref:Uncharacterized protein n=1 Tax=Thermosporothrix sp. COM3 TaxID=2490863 RepID=A0A455SIS2_9CHLR|nr:hypothetical protein KTC_20190 [Thermosporothrix sp. COM3]